MVQHAQQSGADENALLVLRQLPDWQYETPADVGEAVGSIE